MAQISIYGKPITNVFQLLGEYENDISYSIGWALAQSPNFLQAFIQEVTGQSFDQDDVTIRLQAYKRDKGFTDFEIVLHERFYLIVEAKRHWQFPTHDQLAKYASRDEFIQSPAPVKKLLVINDCSQEYADHFFVDRHIDGYEVDVLPYRRI